MKHLFIMIGAPGSGKSSYALNCIKDRTSVYVSRDKIRYSILAPEDAYFAKEKDVLKTFVSTIDECLSDKTSFQNIYADATHLNFASRAKLLNNLTNKPDKISAIYLDIPLETVLARNERRTGREYVPRNVVINMYNSISLPTKKEGFDEIIYINKASQIEKVVEL